MFTLSDFAYLDPLQLSRRSECWSQWCHVQGRPDSRRPACRRYPPRWPAAVQADRTVSDRLTHLDQLQAEASVDHLAVEAVHPEVAVCRVGLPVLALHVARHGPEDAGGLRQPRPDVSGGWAATSSRPPLPGRHPAAAQHLLPLPGPPELPPVIATLLQLQVETLSIRLERLLTPHTFPLYHLRIRVALVCLLDSGTFSRQVLYIGITNGVNLTNFQCLHTWTQFWTW